MSVVGIIAEYNPFHSGHEFLMNQARYLAGSRDPIVVIMSGNYVQRGEMAIIDKWARAQAALESGADLVFELPFSTSVQPADLFSLGSIDQLVKLGVSDLVFGVEDASQNFAYLGGRIAEIPQSHMDFNDYSQTYSTQYNQMVAREVGHEVNEPNAILALAYAVANHNLGEPLSLHPISRIGAGHDDLLHDSGVVQSGSAIRNIILHNGANIDLNQWLPEKEVENLQQQKVYPNWNILFPFLKYRLESATYTELRQIYQMSEGLEYKMKHEIHLAQTFTEFLRRIKSKRYTYSRLRRLSLYTLLNVTQDDIIASFNNEAILLLGYSKIGQKYLKQIRKETSANIVSKVDQKNTKTGSLHLQKRVDRLFEQVMQTDQNFGRRPLEV
ncbi:MULTISPECIES: nucleotidyltransferase [unclassified Lactobacillus]|uniref:nucleotidyltransferase n=1 Tax=unclassified Lactobacillus TaxID=2620435 RepID=UPI000EFC6E44|nr:MULTISPECIES: nucleotidyltransferase [unclassified Lactobacillus]RMC39136.1 nucleotidyltransferase [Lactobacillus sp. ESL0237]RMC43419.1 nucleotidyltransferase [Lactobacillus sp. ESL0234]RMC44331.1 nucleotidyltransferase [Lactobacillus sp. ESL0236]RMC46768.1 nucleotidyltransferase [Lactobacillus sp. ESL0230]RMC49431.1 nucleotidyltransferase [Lactobacillus sp. ESL0225]